MTAEPPRPDVGARLAAVRACLDAIRRQLAAFEARPKPKPPAQVRVYKVCNKRHP